MFISSRHFGEKKDFYRGDVVAHQKRWWLVVRRCGGSLRRCGGSLRRCGGSSEEVVASCQEMWWLIKEMWWLIRRGGGSLSGDVVAH